MLAQNMADKYGNPAGKITLNTRIIFPENVKFQFIILESVADYCELAKEM